MAQKPIPGQDEHDWGVKLNAYLDQEHAALSEVAAQVEPLAEVPGRVDAVEEKVAPVVTGFADQKQLAPDGTSLGWFDGPVLMSNWAPFKIESDTGTPMRAKVQSFLNALSGAGIPGILMPGTYNIEDTLQGVSDAHLIAYGATLRSTTTVQDRRVLDIGASVDRLHLVGLTIDGQKALFTPATEWKHNVAIYGAKNVTLEDVRSHSAKGDGLYVAPHTPNTATAPKNLQLIRCTLEDNHRNNLSIISVDGFRSMGSRYLNANGTNPQAGVDIEPNFTTELVRDIRFIGDEFAGNVGGGFTLSFRVDSTGKTPHGGVKVIGGTSHHNGSVGANLYNGKDVEFWGFDLLDNATFGLGITNGANENIGVYGGTIARNGREGIYGYISNESTHGLGWIRNLRIRDVDVLDNGAATPGTYDGIYLTAIAGSGDVDGVLIDGVKSSNLTTTNQRRGLTTAAKVKNLTIRDTDLVGNTSTAALLADDQAATRRIENVRGLSTTANFAGAGTMTSLVKTVLVAPTAPFTITLPALPEEREYEFVNTNGQAGTHNVTIVANTGQAIRNNGGAAVIDSNFGHLVLRYRQSNWFVVSRTT